MCIPPPAHPPLQEWCTAVLLLPSWAQQVTPGFCVFSPFQASFICRLILPFCSICLLQFLFLSFNSRSHFSEQSVVHFKYTWVWDECSRWKAQWQYFFYKCLRVWWNCNLADESVGGKQMHFRHSILGLIAMNPSSYTRTSCNSL